MDEDESYPFFQLDRESLQLREVYDRELHEDNIDNAVFHPRQRKIYSGGFDHTIREWDFLRDEAHLSFTDHDEWADVVALDINSDGSAVASGSGEAKVWDALSGEVSAGYYDHTDVIWDLEIAPDDSLIISASQEVSVWDANSGAVVWYQHKHEDNVWAVAFSPDGQKAASAGSKVVIYDRFSGEKITEYEGHEGAITDIAFGPDSSQIVSAGLDGNIIVWDLESRQQSIEMAGHEAPVSAISYAPDGGIIAAGDHEGNVKIWSANKGELLEASQYEGEVWTVDISADFEAVLAGGTGNSITVWSLEGQK